MSSPYYPDGMSSSDIPGFNTQDVVISFVCDNCHKDHDQVDASRDGEVTTAVCPACDYEQTITR